MHGGLKVFELNSSVRYFQSTPGHVCHCCVLGQGTLLSQCFSPPRCIEVMGSGKLLGKPDKKSWM